MDIFHGFCCIYRAFGKFSSPRSFRNRSNIWYKPKYSESNTGSKFTPTHLFSIPVSCLSMSSCKSFNGKSCTCNNIICTSCNWNEANCRIRQIHSSFLYRSSIFIHYSFSNLNPRLTESKEHHTTKGSFCDSRIHDLSIHPSIGCHEFFRLSTLYKHLIKIGFCKWGKLFSSISILLHHSFIIFFYEVVCFVQYFICFSVKFFRTMNLWIIRKGCHFILCKLIYLLYFVMNFINISLQFLCISFFAETK